MKEGVLDQLTSTCPVGVSPNMKAEPLLNERHQLSANAFVEIRIWRVPRRIPGSGHDLKYAFTTPAALLADFWKDVDRWRPE
jgi:hypothetical protein